jgi:hypothetical protein
LGSFYYGSLITFKVQRWHFLSLSIRSCLFHRYTHTIFSHLLKMIVVELLGFLIAKNQGHSPACAFFGVYEKSKKISA